MTARNQAHRFAAATTAQGQGLVATGLRLRLREELPAVLLAASHENIG